MDRADVPRILQPGTTDTRWLDGARSAAALAVVLLHVSAGVVVGGASLGSFSWWVANLWDSASRWCVPVFVMISGALLLDSAKAGEPLRSFYVKRASRIVAPLLFWSLFFLAWNYAKGIVSQRPIGVPELAQALLAGRPHPHLWYLYMLVGLYLFAPFVRVVVAHLSRRQEMLLCALIFLVAVAGESYGAAQPENSQFFLAWFAPYLSYFIAGHLIAAERLALTRPAPLFLAAIALTAAGCYALWSVDGPQYGLYFYRYLSPTVVPMSLAAFLLLKRLPPSPALVAMAPLSFGVYLIHPVFLEGLKFLGLYAGAFNPLWSVPAMTAVVALLSVASGWALRRIPLTRRLV